MSYEEKDAGAFPSDEKVQQRRADDSEIVDEKAGSAFGSDSELELGSRDDVRLVNGEPVITTGEDVSRFLLTTRDDGDPALTFRSIVLGTVFAGLGAAMCQVCLRLVTAW